ncbi:MAG: hypothetical protein ACJ04O_07675 [Cellvibrionales bacterium]|tara:strand:- start:27350 stop:27694 length:345 start_codon:yes stop_codon:yes gene_type:complete
MSAHLKSILTLAGGLLLVALSGCQSTPSQLEVAAFVNKNNLLQLDLRLREVLRERLSGGSAEIITSTGRLLLNSKAGIESKVFQLYKDRRGCLLIPQDNPDQTIRLSVLQCTIP